MFREPGHLPGGVSDFPGKALAEGGRDNISVIVEDCLETVVTEIDELDDVVSLDEGEGETVSWIHGDTIPDPEGN